MKTKIVGYKRESTEKIQENALREYAEAHGYELIEIFSDEGISGALENRPGLSQLFEYLETHKNIDGVLIYELDSLTTDIYLQEYLIKQFNIRGKKVFSIKEPDLESKNAMRFAYRMTMNIVSEIEESFIAMRLSADRTKKACIYPNQIYLVKIIFFMKNQGKEPRVIAQELNSKNIPTIDGKERWNAATVQKIIENPIYAGYSIYQNKKPERKELAFMNYKGTS